MLKEHGHSPPLAIPAEDSTLGLLLHWQPLLAGQHRPNGMDLITRPDQLDVHSVGIPVVDHNSPYSGNTFKHMIDSLGSLCR